LEVEVVEVPTVVVTSEEAQRGREPRNPEEPIRRQQVEVVAPPVEVEQEETGMGMGMEALAMPSREATEPTMAVAAALDTGVAAAVELM